MKIDIWTHSVGKNCNFELHLFSSLIYTSSCCCSVPSLLAMFFRIRILLNQVYTAHAFMKAFGFVCSTLQNSHAER